MDLQILSSLLARPVSVYDLSTRFPIGDIRRLEQLGFLCRVGDEYRITDAGRLYLLQSQQLHSIRCDVADYKHDLLHQLEQARNEFSDHAARQDEQRIADYAKAVIDAKKHRRHEYKLAAFTVCFTLLLEHLPDVFDFFKAAVELFRSLLH